VDISGFTKLSGDFCGLGKSGIDELQLATNGYMGQLVNIIYEFGGEIIKFAGDAIICIFSSHFISGVSTKEAGGKLLRRSIGSFSGILSNIDFAAELGANSPSRKEPRTTKSSSPSNYKTKSPSQAMSPDVVLRAMHCAHKLRDVQTEKLSVHVAMSCGEMCFGILGGYENRWECLISGPCLQELSDCLDDAPSKQAVISNDCAMILSTAASADALHSHQRSGVTTVTADSGRYQYSLLALPSGNHRILHVSCEVSRKGSDPKLKSFGSETSIAHNSKIASNLIKQFVPTPIADQLESGTGLNYLAEIREVTTMFMKVSYSLFTFL
jgi:class 3 adenylate cyclase